MDDLDSNPFYKALVSRFKTQLNLASKKCYIIAIPEAASLLDVAIDEYVINSHILMPSKLLKMHYIPIQGGATDDIEIDHTKLIVQCKNDTPSIVRILREEIGYNSDNQHYRILLIDKPLIPSFIKKSVDTFGRRNEFTHPQLSNHDECHQFLEKISQPITNDLESSVRKFQSTYLILPNYLQEASDRIKELIDHYADLYIGQAMKYRIDTQNRPIDELILIAVETYLVHLLHGKLIAAIYQNYSSDDHKVSLKCSEIFRSKITISDLGAQEAFKDFDRTKTILQQLRQISSLQSPLAIVSSLTQIINMISDQLNNCVSLVNLMSEKSGNKICICSDDLIASLVYSVSEAQPINIYSCLKYVELFGWSSCSKDQAAYCLATFQIVANYILNYESPISNKTTSCITFSSTLNGTTKGLALTNSFQQPRSNTIPTQYNRKYNNLYKNMSAEANFPSKIASKSNMVFKDTHPMSPFERELEKITSYVETNSTQNTKKDLSVLKQDDDLGELLSNMVNESYYVSYGRQN